MVKPKWLVQILIWLKQLQTELGVKLEISSMSFDNVLTSLQTGKADLAIAGISATDERKEVFDFSIPYYENKMSFLVRKADLDKYKDLSSLASANIAAQKGTVPETMVKEQLPNAQLTSLTNMGKPSMSCRLEKWMLFIWMNQLLLATQVKTQTLSLHLLT